MPVVAEQDMTVKLRGLQRGLTGGANGMLKELSCSNLLWILDLGVIQCM